MHIYMHAHRHLGGQRKDLLQRLSDCREVSSVFGIILSEM